MRIVIQRVKQASVISDGVLTAEINQGLLVLLGIEVGDTQDDLTWLCNKMINLRIFSDAEGKMNQSVVDINGEIAIVSQFTLHSSTRKGNRPSYTKAARPEEAIPLYEVFVKQAAQLLGKEIPTGRFGADMQVSLINDGPVTIIIDSRSRD